MNIEENQEQFLGEITQFKNDLVGALNTINVEKYREEYKGRYSPERFKEFFIEKAALHILFKYLLIRMIEELMRRGVKVKLNEEGLTKWYKMSKNFKEDYNLLYNIAISDVKREEDLSEEFKNTIYDSEQFIRMTNEILMKQIPKLAKYSFATLDASLTLSIIDTLLKSDNRNEILNISEESPIINFLLKETGLQ